MGLCIPLAPPVDIGDPRPPDLGAYRPSRSRGGSTGADTPCTIIRILPINRSGRRSSGTLHVRVRSIAPRGGVDVFGSHWYATRSTRRDARSIRLAPPPRRPRLPRRIIEVANLSRQATDPFLRGSGQGRLPPRLVLSLEGSGPRGPAEAWSYPATGRWRRSVFRGPPFHAAFVRLVLSLEGLDILDRGLDWAGAEAYNRAQP
jgi:hypothetical protein